MHPSTCHSHNYTNVLIMFSNFIKYNTAVTHYTDVVDNIILLYTNFLEKKQLKITAKMFALVL